MSLRALVWAMEDAPVTDPHELLVLIVLCDHVGSDTDPVAWPSIGRIATNSRLSESTARRCLQRLVAAGVIAPAPDAPPRGARRGWTPTVYRVTAYVEHVKSRGVTVTPHTGGGVSDRPGRGVKTAPVGCHGDTQTKKNHEEPAARRPHAGGPPVDSAGERVMPPPSNLRELVRAAAAGLAMPEGSNP